MIRKPYYLILAITFFLFMFGGLYGYFSTLPKPEMTVGVIGDHSFKSNDKVEYKSLDWDSKPESKIAFILVSSKEKITKEKTTILLKWLDDNKTILFFGKPVSPEDAVLALDGIVPVVPLQGNVETVTIMYGATYYDESKSFIPLFLLSAESMLNTNEKMQDFLFKVESDLLNKKSEK